MPWSESKKAARSAKRASMATFPPLDNASLREAVALYTDDRFVNEAIARYGPIKEWDVSGVTDMVRLFSDCNAFNADLSSWDVSNVTVMHCMFGHCQSFEGRGLSEWAVSGVTTMAVMFLGCDRFNADISEWDVSSVINMENMFYDCEQFNCDLSMWEVSGVACTSGILCGCDAFGGGLPTALLERMRAEDPGFCRNGRWLWRLARRLVRKPVLARRVAYYWLELAARPDAAGNAPRGAVEAFGEDFAS